MAVSRAGKILRCGRRQADTVEDCHRVTARQQCGGNIESNKAIAAEDEDFISQPEPIALDCSQQLRTEILRGIHIRHQAPGRFRRLAARACKESAGACFDRTFAVGHDDPPAR